MSVTVDANLLLYASDASSPRQSAARVLLGELAAGPELVYLFWPVAMAYLRIATHASVFDSPLSPAAARANLDALIGRPHVRTPGENADFWQTFQDVAGGDVVRGNLVTDAHIAALMRVHGVRDVWTADRDFRRFPGIVARDPYER